MPRIIVLATTNSHKTEEVRAILTPLLPPDICLLCLSDLPPVAEAAETGATFEENAHLKAMHYARETGHVCVADDSGLCVDSLAGAPGIYSSRWAGAGATDSDRIDKLLDELAKVHALRAEQRRARFICAAAAAAPDGWLALADGVCDGTILASPSGAGGFGYDPVFFLPQLEKSMAELSSDEKNSMSHRARALMALAPSLQAYLPKMLPCRK